MPSSRLRDAHDDRALGCLGEADAIPGLASRPKLEIMHRDTRTQLQALSFDFAAMWVPGLMADFLGLAHCAAGCRLLRHHRLTCALIVNPLLLRQHEQEQTTPGGADRTDCRVWRLTGRQNMLHREGRLFLVLPHHTC
jgi:hypothetical protein